MTQTWAFDGQCGRAAIEAWRQQEPQCACGAIGCEDSAVYGTVGDADAVWLGCPRCFGRALGMPRVERDKRVAERAAERVAADASAARLDAALAALQGPCFVGDEARHMRCLRAIVGAMRTAHQPERARAADVVRAYHRGRGYSSWEARQLINEIGRLGRR